jgi:hypothetical protein
MAEFTPSSTLAALVMAIPDQNQPAVTTPIALKE